MQRSKLVLGSLVTVGVLGLGAVAVAAEGDTGGDGSLEGTTTTVDSTTTTVAPTTTTVAPAPDLGTSVEDPAGAPADDEGTGNGVERSTEGCDGGTYANHGDHVSQVAHDPDRQPGDVADAAHSDCGKPLSATAGDDEVPAPEVPGTETQPGHGNGNAYGKNE